MTADAVAKERELAEADKKIGAAKEEALKGQASAQGSGNVNTAFEKRDINSMTTPPEANTPSRPIWRPSPQNEALLPTPQGLPRVLSPA